MDYFGNVLEELSDLWEEIESSPHAADGAPVLKALEKAMRVAAAVERRRNDMAAARAMAPVLETETVARSKRARRAA